MLENILNTIEAGKVHKATDEQIIDLGVSQIPNISKDYTDRNRTSPFAFTGNKFEFRAVGSSQNCAGPMTVLNAIMADQLVKFKKDVDALIAKGVEKDEAIFQVLRQFLLFCHHFFLYCLLFLQYC